MFIKGWFVNVHKLIRDLKNIYWRVVSMIHPISEKYVTHNCKNIVLSF